MIEPRLGDAYGFAQLGSVLLPGHPTMAGEIELTVDLTMRLQPMGLLSVTGDETWNFADGLEIASS